MSNDLSDDSFDNEIKIAWDCYDRLGLPFVNSGLPKCHPSYRNQYIIPPINMEQNGSRPHSDLISTTNSNVVSPACQAKGNQSKKCL